MKRVTITITLGLLLLAGFAAAGIPELMNYQGLLTNASGTPVPDGNYDLVFTIYDASSGGNVVWTETHSSVPVTAGRMNLLLGSLNAMTDATFNSSERYLGIKIGADSEISPRTRLVSAPYAQRIATVDGASGGKLSGGLTVEANAAKDPALAAAEILVVSLAGDTVQINPDQNVVLRGVDASGNERFYMGTSQPNGALFTITDNSGGKVEFGTADNAMTVFDAGGEAQIAIGLDLDGGGAISILQNAAAGARAATERVKLTKDGLFFFGEAVARNGAPADTFLRIDNIGNILAKGQPNIGDNISSGDSATVSGGYGNIADEHAATVSGGSNNLAIGVGATVGGGDFNECNGIRATVAGGTENDAGGWYASIGGGQNNFAHGYWSGIASGANNTAVASYAAVGGGENNHAQGNLAFVAGGTGSQVKAIAGAVGGGAGNIVWVSADTAVIAGGSRNQTYALLSTIGGGHINRIDTSGEYATIAGGWLNRASGTAAAITGGQENRTNGDYAMASGFKAKALHNGAMVFSAMSNPFWADTTASGGINQIVMRADSGLYLTNQSGVALYDPAKLINTSTGAYLTSSGTWTNASDKNLKENFEKLDLDVLLNKIAEMEISRWNYKSDGNAVEHIGPTAQDFRAAFGLGSDDVSIATVDADGVALAAIKALARKTREIEDLRMRLEALERMLTGATPEN